MATPAFVFSADWHLCRSAWKSPRGITGDADFALAQVVDLCLDLGVPLLAGGDLFDSQEPDSEDVRVCHAQMARMRQAGLPVYFVQGQHERRPTPWMRAAADPWPIHLDRDSVQVGPFTVAGLDWQPAGQLKPYLEAMAGEAFDFLLCHQVWGDLMNRGPDQAEGMFADVPPPTRILTGDFHKHVALPRALSPGSLHMLSIDEPDQKAVFVVNDAGSTTSRGLIGRVVYRKSVGDEGDLERLLAHDLTFCVEQGEGYAACFELPTSLYIPLLHVAYPADLPGAAARLQAACAGKFHLFLKPVAPGITESAGTPSAAAVAEAPGLLGALESWDLSACPDPGAARRDLETLLGGDRPPAALIRDICDDYDREAPVPR